MTEPYNYDNNGYDNNHLQSQDNEFSSQDNEFSNLLNNNDSGYENNDHQNEYDENQASENNETLNPVTQEINDETLSEDDSETVPTLSYDSIKEKLINAPSNATQEPRFGEKDMYKVINLVTLLSECDDDVIKWIEDIIRIGGNDNVRRSMNIIKMDKNEFEEHTDTIKVMKSILKISQDGAANGDAFKTVIDLMNTVDNMTDNQRDGLLKLNRKLIRSSGAKIRISSKKTSNSSEIAQDLHKVLTEDDVIPQYVESLDSIIDAIKQIIK